MFVSAAIAAYLPPLALVPQMATAARRPPTSRAVFAATKNTTKNRSSVYPGKIGTTHSRCSQSPRSQYRWKKMWGQVYDSGHIIVGRNYLLCQADNPRCSDRRSIEVRRIETRGNHYADEEVLFPRFEAFQSRSAI